MTACAYRELYAPGHFGNSYEVMGDEEAEDLFAEASWWGFNAYGDWPDAADLRDPDGTGHGFLLPQALLERKVRNLLLAQRAGLQTDLLLTPNHVWMDQVTPANAAVAVPGKIFGQLVCPSRPDAHRLILDNHERLFARLRAAGVKLSSLTCAPYDYGGCGCPACQPWILTFGRLVRDLVHMAQRHFPGIQARLVGWWWTPEEHIQFNAWADAEAPGLFRSLSRHVPYGATAPGFAGALPAGCASHLFVHIGYPDQRGDPSDCYGPWGPVVAATRIPQTLAGMAASGMDGFVAYSEGAFDDVNKALLAGIASGRFADAEAVLRCYAGRYFGADAPTAAGWAEWLAGWSAPFARDLAAARREFDRLAAGARPSWRLEQFAAKLRLFEANQAVERSTAWDAARHAAAARFTREQERLYRRVWGLGLVRHVLHPRFHPPCWAGELAEQVPSEA